MAEKEKDSQKRHTMGHPPEHIPDLDSPRSRSPLKKDKKDKVSLVQVIVLFYYLKNFLKSLEILKNFTFCFYTIIKINILINYFL